MKKKGLWEEVTYLKCNRCQKKVHKIVETILIGDNEDVHCMYCLNWLCGYNDAFGYRKEK